MITPIPDTIIWLCDWQPERLSVVSREIADAVNCSRVEGFLDNPSIRRAIVPTDTNDNLPPWLFVTDRVGTDDKVVGGKSAVRLIREYSPLSMVLLFSEGAANDPDLVRMLQCERLIDEFVWRGEPQNLFETMARWLERWNMPIARRLRDYIQSCDDPSVAYFPDDEGNYLNIWDVHREIVRGSKLGLEAESGWNLILEDSSATA